MGKALGLTLALLLTLSLSAAAEQVTGTIKAIDRTDNSFVLDDGTRIWVAEGTSMATLKEGVSVKASYEERDGRKIGTALSTNLGTVDRADMFDRHQAE